MTLDWIVICLSTSAFSTIGHDESQANKLTGLMNTLTR